MLLCGSIYSHTPSPLKAPISLLFLSLLLVPVSGRCDPAPGIAMHGTPAQPPGFTHFPYADPDAPKGGRLVLAKRGSFDSLNPLIA
jgi:peptide/nickel transport system substrate-binding protein